MKRNKIITAAVVSLAFIATSCQKYEEGPTVSLLTKKARVENTWKIDKAFRSGQDVTNDYDEYTLQLRQDGDAKLAALYTIGSFSFEADTDGTWEFENNKENLKLDFEDNIADKTYQILKLEKDEMWLREIGAEDELRLVTK